MQFVCPPQTLPLSILPKVLKTLRQLILGAFVILFPVFLGPSASAQNSVTVEWQRNPEPDIAGYVVYLGTTSGVYSTIQDVGNISSWELGDLSTGTVHYCAVQAYNAAGLVSALSSEISFSISATAVLLNSWAASGGLSGAAAVASAMPFADGVRNLLKFAFNMNPSGPDVRTLVKGTGTAGLPAITLNGSEFTIEYLRRKDSGLIYRPKFSTNLGVYQEMTETPVVTPVNAAWERVVIKKAVNTAGTPRLFGTVEVTMP